MIFFLLRGISRLSKKTPQNFCSYFLKIQRTHLHHGQKESSKLAYTNEVKVHLLQKQLVLCGSKYGPQTTAINYQYKKVESSRKEKKNGSEFPQPSYEINYSHYTMTQAVFGIISIHDHLQKDGHGHNQ